MYEFLSATGTRCPSEEQVSIERLHGLNRHSLVVPLTCSFILLLLPALQF